MTLLFAHGGTVHERASESISHATPGILLITGLSLIILAAVFYLLARNLNNRKEEYK